MKSRLLILIFCFLPIIGHAENLPAGSSSDGFLDADLIFQLDGNSDFSRAITDATGNDEGLNFIHVGILRNSPEGYEVIEASPEAGVVVTPLEDFIKASVIVDGHPGIVVKRLDMDFPRESVVENALKYLGQPYDWWYLPDNGKMYCSELVYESFVDFSGEKIFQTVPMNFKASDGSYPEFWERLFEEIDQEIPQGIPGTNPNQIASHPALVSLQLDSLQKVLNPQ